jgi:sporulation protein YlmC with PRC-barrel domain
MLYLSSRLRNLPLLSLRSGGRIGTVTGPIINPHNLHIDGFFCLLHNAHTEQIVLDIAVRDISARGIIINDHQDVSDSEDLVRLQPVIDIRYELVGKQVIASKKRLGKIVDYAIDVESLFIQKFYAQPPVWQAINQHRLTFDRTTIIEITDKTVIVQGPEVKVTKTNKVTNAPLLNNYSASASLTEE